MLGSGYGDRITGDDEINILTGRGGSDTLNGEEGDDILNGGPGGDTLNGGDDTDTVTYADAAEGVTVSLSSALNAMASLPSPTAEPKAMRAATALSTSKNSSVPPR